VKFEWDSNKDLINIKKHGVSFEEAIYVFSDVDAISLFDTEHSNTEDRWITIGKNKKSGLITVIHTERFKNNEEYIRIISARKAEESEEFEYIKRIGVK